MDQPTSPTSPKFIRWLPYWAVFQTDLRQTLQSWIYRLWVVVTVMAAVGYLLYRVGVHREAGIIQSATILTGDLLRGMLLGSISLIIVLTVSSIASERGTLADSVLSRGISRYQYFLAKWHARLVVVLMTFGVLGVSVLVSSSFMLNEDISWSGCVVGLISVGAILFAITSWGVTIGALCNSTVMGITILWLVLYGTGFVFSMLPAPFPSPDRTLSLLPQVLRGQYDTGLIVQLVLVSMVLSGIAVVAGLYAFAKKDV